MPAAVSIVSRVLVVQREKSPVEKVSEKIGGTALVTVAVAVAGVPAVAPSSGVTATWTESPKLPLPATDRSNVSVSAVVTVVLFGVPFTVQT